MTDQKEILKVHVVDNVKNWLKYYVHDGDYSAGQLDRYLKYCYEHDMVEWIERNIYAHLLKNLESWYEEVKA